MENQIGQIIIETFPNLAGLAILAFILYRQNERLLTELFERIDDLEAQVAEIKMALPPRKEGEDAPPPWG